MEIESVNDVFLLVANRQWTQSDFEDWVTRSRSAVDNLYNEGYADGRRDAEYDRYDRDINYQ